MKRVQFYLKQTVEDKEITRYILNIDQLHPEEKESILDYYQKTSKNIFTWNDVFGVDSLLGQQWRDIKVGDKIAVDKWTLPYAMNSMTTQLDDHFLGKVKRRITEVTEISGGCYLVKDFDCPFDFSSRISKGARRTYQLTLLSPKEKDKLLANEKEVVKQADIYNLPLLAILK
jgi:hypothetical protein